MTDNKKNGNPNMPKFDKLTDRIINEPTPSPMFFMKTNLDSDDVSKDNPYFQKEAQKSKQTNNKEDLEDFFQ